MRKCYYLFDWNLQWSIMHHCSLTQNYSPPLIHFLHPHFPQSATKYRPHCVNYAMAWITRVNTICTNDTLVGINRYIEKKKCVRYVIKPEKCYECGSARMQIILTKGSTKFTAEDMGYVKRQSLMAPGFGLYSLIARETWVSHNIVAEDSSLLGAVLCE
jgi:hypothetical protein